MPHVFDRIPNTPDPRDWKMADHLMAPRLLSMSTFDAIDTALAADRGRGRSGLVETCV